MSLEHPGVAGRDCRSCKRWQYAEGGEHPNTPIEDGVLLLHGKKMPRKAPCPCDTPTGCPKGHWRNPIELTPQNWRVWNHYRQCKAVGQFPVDCVVRENAAIIADVEERWSRLKDAERAMYLKALCERPIL